MSEMRVGESSLVGSPRPTVWYLKKRQAESAGGGLVSDRYVSGQRALSERQVAAQGLAQFGLVGMLLSGTLAALSTFLSAMRGARVPVGPIALFAGMTALFGASLVLGTSDTRSQTK